MLLLDGHRGILPAPIFRFALLCSAFAMVLGTDVSQAARQTNRDENLTQC